jgi:hypothetical protein
MGKPVRNPLVVNQLPFLTFFLKDFFYRGADLVPA